MNGLQEKYLANVREILSLRDFNQDSALSFEDWYHKRLHAEIRLEALRGENIRMLNEQLFPALDDLFGASEARLEELAAFADALMDWSTNLDCGVYVAIHDAMLRLCRIRRDRDGTIRELYKLGMGLYYLRRSVEGLDERAAAPFNFENEMVFTEASSYIRYFNDVDREETKGYIIRSLANVSLCTRDRKRRIAVSARTLDILNDTSYRSSAPGLPWDAFVRKTHQQMSVNRHELSGGDLTKEELAAVLDSCYEVFKPEEAAENPSIRWRWPYYEMEYNCGYVDLKTTLERLERLIQEPKPDPYDVSGMYGSVQLPLYYGRLLAGNPQLLNDRHYLRFLDGAYRQMMDAMLQCPAERMDDYFVFLIDAVITNFREFEGCINYREVTVAFMRRFTGSLYISSRLSSDLMRCFCGMVFEQDETFFDDIPFIKNIENSDEKRERLLSFASDCGFYHDFGLIKMNLSRTMQTRNLFENEYRMYMLHTISGYDDLRKRPSTACFADAALGHHRWYDGTDGYPNDYVRNDSPYRQLTDVMAVASALQEEKGDIEEKVRNILEGERRRFSPMVTAFLTDAKLVSSLDELLSGSRETYYRSVYETL